MSLDSEVQPHGAVFVRRQYLEKRATLIRESLEKSGLAVKSLASEIQSHEFNATKDELLFAEALLWMQKKMHLEASISELAKEFKVSVRKIQRLISVYAAKTYTSLLLEMRIEESKKYLAEFKRTVGEVAYLVGIKDHAYFTYLFRKHTGLTPSQFRLTLMK